ncbi:MAG: hypothetical protein OXC61_08595 [Flavobacteriaceae bacterium]|nr:hypothetical protein [Flavobacteriaceae bacterium]
MKPKNTKQKVDIRMLQFYMENIKKVSQQPTEKQSKNKKITLTTSIGKRWDSLSFDLVRLHF